MKVRRPTVIGTDSSSTDLTIMLKLSNQLFELHETFFDNDTTNKMAMGLGFILSAASIVAVFALYQM